MKLARSGDFWAGALLAALGAYVVLQARGWTYSGPDGPGAGFFPLWYGLAIVALSLALIVKSALARSAAKHTVWSDVGRALVCWAAFVLSVAFIDRIGFMASFALLTWFIVTIMFRKPQVVAIPTAIGGAIAFQLLFDTALGVTLPLGFGF